MRAEGVVEAVDMEATRWRDRLPRCDDAPPPAGEVQIVGRIDLSRGTWQSTQLDCGPSQCCNEMSPEGLGVITPKAGADFAIQFIAVEALVGPNPWSWGGRLDCEWGPWERVLRRTTVRASGTLDGHGLRVHALCRMP